MIRSSIPKLIIFVFILCLTILFSCENKSSSVILLRQAEQLIETNPSEALQLLDSIREPQNMDKNHYMDFIVFTLQAKYKIGFDLSADTLIFKAKDFYNQTKAPQKAALANFFTGAVYYDMKEPDKALISLFRAEDYARKANDDLLVGKCLYFSGTLFYEEDMMDSAVCKYKQALVYFDRTKDNDLLKLKTITSIGRAFEAQGILDSAYHYFDKGLSQAKNVQNKTYEVISIHNLGFVYLQMGQYNKAESYFAEALERTTNTEDSLKIYLNYSLLYNKIQQLDLAGNYIDLINKRLGEITNNSLLESIYDSMSDYYSQIGNDKQALYYKEQQRKTEAKIAQANQADKLITAETNHKLYIQKQEQKAKRTQELLIQAIIILVIIAVYYFATTKRRNKYKQEKSGTNG